MYKYLAVRSAFEDDKRNHFDRDGIYLVLQESAAGVLLQAYENPVLLPWVYIDLFCDVKELPRADYAKYKAVLDEQASLKTKLKNHESLRSRDYALQRGQSCVLAFLAENCQGDVQVRLQAKAQEFFADLQQKMTQRSAAESEDRRRSYEVDNLFRHDSADKGLLHLVRCIDSFAGPYYRDGNLISTWSVVPPTVPVAASN